MLDQHYMIDQEWLIRVTNIADLNKTDIVLEIGGGTGNLTAYLRKIAKQVYVIEKDKELIKPIEYRFKNFKNVAVICGDATITDFPEFTKCVSNLPYTICEPLMWRLTRTTFELTVFVVPKKFVEKLKGDKPSRLHLLIQNFFSLEIFENIPPAAFDPQPRTMSTIIRLRPKKEGNFFLREFLSQFDKKTKNALRWMLVQSGMTKKEATEQIALKIRPAIQDRRISSLSLEEILEIVKKFSEQEK